MSNTAEKLLYLQNGVFKRKEMSNGIQYYSNNSFGTFALPSANGNYVHYLRPMATMCSPITTMYSHGPMLVM